MYVFSSFYVKCRFSFGYGKRDVMHRKNEREIYKDVLEKEKCVMKKWK